MAITTTARRAGTTLGGGALGLDVLRGGTDWEGRTVYSYAITHEGKPFHAGNDLRTGVGIDHGPAEMLRTLASFLGAAVESWESDPRGENAGLFPDYVLEIASAYSDEIVMLSMDEEY